MQMGQKYGNGFGSSPSVPVLIEIPNFMIEIWKIVRHHVLVPRPDSGHPNTHTVNQYGLDNNSRKLGIFQEPSLRHDR